jgi:hypothetical protein
MGKDLKGCDFGYFGAKITVFILQRPNEPLKFCQNGEPLNQE